jgi:hypothetical protein
VVGGTVVCRGGRIEVATIKYRRKKALSYDNLAFLVCYFFNSYSGNKYGGYSDICRLK